MKMFLTTRQFVDDVRKGGWGRLPSSQTCVEVEGSFLEDASCRPDIPFQLDEKGSLFDVEEWNKFLRDGHWVRLFWHERAQRKKSGDAI